MAILAPKPHPLATVNRRIMGRKPPLTHRKQGGFSRRNAKFEDSALTYWPRRGRISVTPCAALAEHGVWMPVPMPASKMPHTCGEAYVPVEMHTCSLMYGIFEAGFHPVS